MRKGYAWPIIWKVFRSRTAYRMDILYDIVGCIISMYMFVAIWHALYRQPVHVSATLQQTITYTVLRISVLYAFRFRPGSRIAQSVYSGDLGVDMLRPVPLLPLHLLYDIGDSLFYTLTTALPTLALAIVCFGMLPPAGILALGGYLLTVLLGAFIYMFFDCIVSYLAFWLTDTWYISWFEEAIVGLLGGMVVPMWFYPEALNRIAGYLPFKYISFTSVDIYLGNIVGGGILQIVGMQLFWIAVLFACERLIWFAAQKKITVQGG